MTEALFTDNELTTRRIFANEAVARQGSHAMAFVACRMAFQAAYHSALPQDRVAEIAEALSAQRFDAVDREMIGAELSRLVKRKVLRSRMIRKVRHYEVNY